MATLRASFTIAAEVLLEFNEMVPAGERSKVVQSLMQQALAEVQQIQIGEAQILVWLKRSAIVSSV